MIPYWLAALIGGVMFGLGSWHGWHEAREDPTVEYWDGIRPRQDCAMRRAQSEGLEPRRGR